jgi:hypothetical protein
MLVFDRAILIVVYRELASELVEVAFAVVESGKNQ